MSWISSHRPKTLDDIVGNRRLVRQCREWAEDMSGMPHLLFHGPPGTGKTSIAGIFTRMTCGGLELPLFQNAADLLQISLQGFTEWIKTLKIYGTGARNTDIVAVLDEVDLLPKASQEFLAAVMANDTVLSSAWRRGRRIHFILITNHIRRIHPAVIRNASCQEFRLSLGDTNKIIRRFFKEDFDGEVCRRILRKSGRDLRVVSVLSDFQRVQGHAGFMRWLDDGEKEGLLGDICDGKAELGEWFRRGQTANDFYTYLAGLKRFPESRMLRLQRDLVFYGYGQTVLQEFLYEVRYVDGERNVVDEK